MKKPNKIIFFICIIINLFAANCFILFGKIPSTVIACPVCAVLVNVIPSFSIISGISMRVRMCWHGTTCLRVFQLSLLPSLVLQLVVLFTQPISDFFLSLLLCVVLEGILFWNGMISLYLTSTQLGVKQRLIGALCGMIPIINLVVLDRMLRTTTDEVKYELRRELADSQRKKEEVCKTKYPILMVHGVFFRDFKYFNYWGRIPVALEKNGATIYYGNHHSAASVQKCAEELAQRIEEIVSETGCEKLNIIAHSKGGLDCRYAIEHYGAGKYIASLTTVNTPHRGCKFADFLLEKAPEALRDKIADTYNSTFKKFGDEEPDFIEAVSDLTSSVCSVRDNEMPQPENIFSQSIGSKLVKATGGRFPLNLTYHFVNLFDGANDGLVGEESFKWGEKYTFVEPKGQRGISHADMIDLNRENLPDFDVREFYVQLVSDLKNRGL